MKATVTPIEAEKTALPKVAAMIREDLLRADCPENFIEIACAAAAKACDETVRAAETRERTRIIRWLRSVADTYAARLRAAGQGPDTIYWADHLEAFSQAANAIARRRHARPH